MAKIYTRTGDDGTTSIIGGRRLSKADIRVEAYGTIDELNSFVGLLLSEVADCRTVVNQLATIQHRLFEVGTSLAQDNPEPGSFDATALEKAIDDFQLSPLRSFILPGGSRRASLAHVCRTVCRRAERRICQLSMTSKVDDEAKKYINRLSDYFFALGRKLNDIDGCKEESLKD